MLMVVKCAKIERTLLQRKAGLGHFLLPKVISIKFLMKKRPKEEFYLE